MTNELVSAKYTFACDPDECDVLIELTSSDGFGFPSGVTEITCPCGRKPVLLSVVNATIAPINQTKEEKMEEVSMNNLTLSDAEKYNPNLLVTYKVIKGYSDPEFTTDKVTSIEWDLHNGRQAQKRVGVFEDKINTVKDIISEVYADSQDQDTLRSIAEALGIELTREVEWSATIEVNGTITIDLLEDDVEVESEIYDNLYVDSQNGQIEIVDTEVCNVREL